MSIKSWEHCKCGHAFIHHFGVCRHPGCRCKQFKKWEPNRDADGWLHFKKEQTNGKDEGGAK